MPDDQHKWTFQVSERGYTFYYDGHVQSGVALPPDQPAPTGEAARKLIQAYTDYCRQECDWRNEVGLKPLVRPEQPRKD